MKHLLLTGCCSLLLLAGLAGNLPAKEGGTEESSEKQAPPESRAFEERKARERFLASYTAAEKPGLKADAVLMLKGLKEKDSQRLLAQLLGDTIPEVRRNACLVIQESEDPSGFFVKPLVGMLSDAESSVRVAAAKALGTAKVKKTAAEALVEALQKEAEKKKPQASFAYALHKSLEGLSSEKIGKDSDVTGLAKWWAEWWQKNKAKVEEADEAYLKRLAPPPESKDKLPTPPSAGSGP